ESVDSDPQVVAQGRHGSYSRSLSEFPIRLSAPNDSSVVASLSHLGGSYFSTSRLEGVPESVVTGVRKHNFPETPVRRLGRFRGWEGENGFSRQASLCVSSLAAEAYKTSYL